MVTFELRNRVAFIGLDRAEKRNAINEALITALRSAVLAAHDQADVAVIYGHGPHFSAGLDLAEALSRYESAGTAGTADRKRTRHSWHEVFDLIARGPIPWVAALHGAVVGGGLELATAAHIRVGDDTSFFALPEGQRGIFVGGGGSVRIQRAIGFSAMADMMLTGRVLDASEGEKVGILRYVVPKGQAVHKAEMIANQISENSAETNWKVINVLPRVNDLSHDDGLFVEYLANNMQRPATAVERLREFVTGRAKPLGAPGLPESDAK